MSNTCGVITSTAISFLTYQVGVCNTPDTTLLPNSFFQMNFLLLLPIHSELSSSAHMSSAKIKAGIMYYIWDVLYICMYVLYIG